MSLGLAELVPAQNEECNAAVLQPDRSDHEHMEELVVSEDGGYRIGPAKGVHEAAERVENSAAEAGRTTLIRVAGTKTVNDDRSRCPASTTATATASSGVGSVNVNTPITGWAVGDLITVDTEAVTITSISGGNISFAPNLAWSHPVASTSPVYVGNLSRNAVVRSSTSISSRLR